MTTIITVTNGIGTQAGRVGAYDRAAAFAITGLATEFYSAAVTGLFTTADGATALAPLATGTVSATGTVTLTFDTDTAAMATLMGGRQDDAAARLTVYATATESNACLAAVKVSPAADHGTTTTATDATAASLAEAQALVDAHNASGTAHADIRAAMVSWPTADSETTLADADLFAVGQLVDDARVWCVKTGTQLKTWLKTYCDGLYAALAHKTRHATGGADALTAADVGAIATGAAPLLATLTAAGSRYRATGAGAVGEAKCLVALAEAGAGVWAPTLTAGAHHTVTRSGIWTGITPSGLEIGEGCAGVITGAFATTTTGVTADASGDLDDIAGASVGWVIWREASGYRMVCWAKA